MGNSDCRVVGLRPSCSGSVRTPCAPTHRALHRCARVLVAHRVLRAFVEHHHDVAAESQLHVDGRFRREHVPVAIQMRLKRDALVGDLAQTAQAEDLEAARIGQDGARPGHEAVQPAQAADQFVAGPQKQMIGVGQQDAHVQIVGQIALRESLDRGLRAHRHEDRRLDGAVRRVQQAGASTGLRALGHQLEIRHVSKVGQALAAVHSERTRVHSWGRS